MSLFLAGFCSNPQPDKQSCAYTRKDRHGQHHSALFSEEVRTLKSLMENSGRRKEGEEEETGG